MAKYDTEGFAQFIHSIPKPMLQLPQPAAQTLGLFGGKYLCEKLFSVMKVNRTAHRSGLTDNPF